MAKASKELVIPDEVILNKIYIIHGQKVMLDRDLAKLYGVTTGNLNSG
jgi:ORF6N domain